ncbi:MAG: hypothetical protein QOF48_3324 [Verrucomicrobiota bacterium]|jgi:hypothetical protein
MCNVKRRRLLLLLVVLILGGIIFATRRSGPPEPEYQGRKLSAWIDGVRHSYYNGFDTNALLAVRAIGSNAVPWLLSELDARDGVLQSKFNDFAARRGRAFRLSTSADIRQRRAVDGLCYIGPRARGAIPELVQRIGREQNIRPSSVEVALARLAHRGTFFREKGMLHSGIPAFLETDPAAAELPAVRREIIDRVRQVADESSLSRRLAAMRILFMIPETGESVPVFLHALKSTNEIERIYGANGVGSAAKEPVSVIPPLIAALDDPSHLVQEAAARALGNYYYYPQPRSAIPALRKLATNGEPLVQRAATDALQKIDPEGTAEANLRSVK